MGVRIVCNNRIDVKRLKNYLKEIDNLSIKKVKNHNDPGGYRATHFKAVYVCRYDGKEYSIKCEIQVRTLLEDAWAVLTHHDVYKNQSDLPVLAGSISKNLSRMLSALDKMANDFRKEIESKVKPSNDLSDSAPLDKQGIAFLFVEIFGKLPHDYEVEYLLRRASELGIENIGEARKGLNKDVFERLSKIHGARFSSLDIGSVELFEFGILKAIQGSSAYKEYRKKIEGDWAEIEAYCRGEALSQLPETYEELIEMLRRGHAPYEALKELSGSTCYRCGNDIISPETAAHALLDYYESDADESELESLIAEALPEEAESVDFSGACQYCGYQMSKDD